MAQKIVIFGGSFDPIHSGHIKAAKIALKALKADIVYFVPSYSSTLKNQKSASAKQRYDITKLAIQDEPKFQISNWNIKNHNLYSFHLVKHFQQKFRNAKLYLLLGSDQINNFDTWYKCDELAALIDIVYVTRDNAAINKNNVSRFKAKYLGNSNINISSSRLRQRSFKKYLDHKVIDYINDHAMYQEERIARFLSTKRWQHCLSTAKFAFKLAKSNNYHNPKDAYIAGLFHDLAKEFCKQDLLSYAKKLNIKKYTAISTLHPFAAYYIMKHHYLFNNQAILQAVYRHTEPIQNDLTMLDKIIYVADKCEPLRIKQPINNLFDVKKMQQLALKDINAAFDAIYQTLNQYYSKLKSA